MRGRDYAVANDTLFWENPATAVEKICSTVVFSR